MFADRRTDVQTHKQTDMLITVLRLSTGGEEYWSNELV